jgi:PKHD-type hydroxylase
MKNHVKVIEPKSWAVYDTQLPGELCDAITEYFTDIPIQVGKESNGVAHRKCGMKWVDPSSWIGPFLWKYIQQTNDRMFQYDITDTHMTEIHQLEYRPGHYYHWHIDDDINVQLQYAQPTRSVVRSEVTEYVRKLSFTLQLTDPGEYTGGDVQIFHDICRELFTIPKERGTLCIFDSRTRHRVKPIKTGKRFVLVGWVIGPRWK